jgi:hypothetical protein
MSDFRKISGFEFLKAGEFFRSDEPYQFKDWESQLVLKLQDERYEKADETAYLLMDDERILYVGEYTYNLKDRWISKNHVNHHKYDNIYELVDKGKSITLWLALSPYCEIQGYGELNVSKSLEQQIMRDHPSECEWNSRNKQSEAREWRAKNCIRLDSFTTQSVELR